MRVIFLPFEYKTHFWQQAPVAWALRAAGHDVLVACTPALGEAVTAIGLNYTDIGDHYDVFGAYQDTDSECRRVYGHKLNSDGPQGLTEEESKQFYNTMWRPFARYAAGMTDDLVALIRDHRADLVITDPWVFAGPLAAQLTGVPLVRLILGPDTLYHLGGAGQSGPHDVDPRTRWPSVIVEVFDRFGVELRDEYADAMIDPVPESMQQTFEIRRLPMQFVPYNGAGQVPAWLREPTDRPRVCVTLGTMTGGMKSQERFLLPDIVDAVAKANADLVLAVTDADADAEKLGPLPAGARLARQLPLGLLLPSCAALVHQGGAGTALTAARYGVPQIIIPEVADQPWIAASVSGTGAGITLDADRVADAGTVVSEILGNDTYRQAALGLQREMLALPTPAELVPQLEELARESA